MLPDAPSQPVYKLPCYFVFASVSIIAYLRQFVNIEKYRPCLLTKWDRALISRSIAAKFQKGNDKDPQQVL